MYNAFAPYEQNFREWLEDDYPDVSPMTRDWLEHLLDPMAKRQLWHHQRDAVLRTVYAYEVLHIKSALLNIVTGGGKTAIIAAVMAWLKYSHDIAKFVVLCPNTIVRDRLEDDFRNAKVFRDFKFFPSGAEHYTNEMGLHVMESGAGPQGILESGVVLANIQQLYTSNAGGQRNLSYLMQYSEEFAVFNDEAHNTPATEYDSVLYLLSSKSRFRLDTTATPDRADGQTPDSKMIFDYGITDAQAETPPIIKSIVVYQPNIGAVELTYTNPDTGEKRSLDEMDEEFANIEKRLTSTQWVTDPDPMRKQIQIALDRLKEQTRRADAFASGSYKPLLFVVAICIKDAEQARDILQREFHLRTLLVTEQSDDREREEARLLGKPGSPYEAVVSVLMLREGWDVPAVSVILLLRKFSSVVYGQQVVGRGLRLNVRDKDLQEICAIVDHEKLRHQWLWEMVGAKVNKNVDQLTLLGDEDLPPKRKPQFIAHPELLIQIPDPMEQDTDFDLGLDDIPDLVQDYPNWEALMEGFDYTQDVEITDVEIRGVTAKQLDGGGFLEMHGPPSLRLPGRVAEETYDPVTLVDRLKHSVLDIARYLLIEEGVGSHELGNFYDVLMDHVQVKLLRGQTAGRADVADLKYALSRLSLLQFNFKSRPGLAGSVVAHKRETVHANR